MVLIVLALYAGMVIKDLVPAIKNKEKGLAAVLIILLIIGLVMSLLYAFNVKMTNYLEQLSLFLIKKLGLIYPQIK